MERRSSYSRKKEIGRAVRAALEHKLEKRRAQVIRWVTSSQSLDKGLFERTPEKKLAC